MAEKITITIRYFASFREQLNCASEVMHFNMSDTPTIQDVLVTFSKRSEIWQKIFNHKNDYIIALNQEICLNNASLNDKDELAFYPPVTGG